MKLAFFRTFHRRIRFDGDVCPCYAAGPRFVCSNRDAVSKIIGDIVDEPVDKTLLLHEKSLSGTIPPAFLIHRIDVAHLYSPLACR